MRVQRGEDGRDQAIVGANHGKRHMLHADVPALQPDRLAGRDLEHLLGARGEREMLPVRRHIAALRIDDSRADHAPFAPRTPAPPTAPLLGVDRLRGPVQRVIAERRLDPGPHRVQVDPDGGQRFLVQAGEQAGTSPDPDLPDDLLLDPLRRDPLFTQDRTGGFVGRGDG